MNAVLDKAWERHGPAVVVCLFSGGHDSLVATHLTAAWCEQRGVAFRVASIDTTTAIRETLEFIKAVARAEGWAHRFYEPPVSFRDLVLDTSVSAKGRPRGGFPGPGWHRKPYNRLKERCVDMILREETGPVLLVSGCRSAESVRRMAFTKPIQVDKARKRRVWVAPIHNWSKPDCNAYIERYGLPRNPVSDVLHRSGECNCGAFASGRDELREMLAWYPEMRWLVDLEAEARALGIKACVWGQRPPDVHEDQSALWGADENESFTDTQMLCTSCAYRNEAA